LGIDRIQNPELFFGLVAPVGVDLDMISEVLITELNRQNYTSIQIQVTTIMREIKSTVKIQESPYLERIKTRIDYANDVCRQLKRKDALAAITMGAIQTERERVHKEAAEGRGEPNAR
jgi:hypothetical protein